mgnify:CR=1 FL=1
MVRQFFTSSQTCQRILECPLGSHINEYAALLCRQGYARQFARRQIGWLAEFGRWFQQHGLQATDLNSGTAARYIQFCARRGRLQYGERFVFKQFLTLLRGQGLLPPERSPQSKNARQQVEEDFEAYLSKERGLSRATLLQYVPIVRCFLAERFGKRPLRFDQMRVTDITSYVQRHAYDSSPARAKHLVTALRAFLRYLRHQGHIATNLADCVPPVAFWRLSTLPKFLTPDQVQQTLDSCDHRTPQGRRNYAILLLLSRLGLRACEVVALTLEDIRWDTGEITVRGKVGRSTRLPLPRDVGQALANYLQKDRPSCPSRRVFVRSRAPREGFANSKAISTIVHRALKQGGVTSVSGGAHLFRHTLATQMLRRGASLTEIAELLRHRGINTTAIYAKVDMEALRALAQPWAGGVR